MIEVKPKVCKSCAHSGVFKMTPCPKHTPSYGDENCEHTTAVRTVVENGFGFYCATCGYSFGYVNEENENV